MRFAVTPASVLLCSLACVVLSAQDAASLYRDAMDKQKSGDLAGAVQLYRECLKADAANLQARSNLGVALAGLGRYDDAIGEYQEALKQAPEQVRPFLRRNVALAYYKSGRIPEALQIFLDLRVAQPEERSFTVLAADCYLQIGEPAKAVELLQPLSSVAGDDKTVAYLLGTALIRSGKAEEGQRVLDPILKDPDSAEANFAVGLAMFGANDFPSAVKAFGRAVALNPSLPGVYSFYGRALLFTGDAAGAADAFQKQLAADPNDYDSNVQMSEILLHDKKFADAEPLLRRALLVRPASSEARFDLAEALSGENKNAAARQQLEALIKAQPQYPLAHERLAKLYQNAGLHTEAMDQQQLAARYSAAQPSASGVAEGASAPQFHLAESQGTHSVAIASPQPGRPTVLVFGSYTCPNFRTAAPVLNQLSADYRDHAAFLLVYIREAHSDDKWQSSINERERIALAPAANGEQKRDYALLCTRKLHLAFPAVVDGMDGAAEKAYAAWPSRVYVIGADGRVRYTSFLSPLDFNAAALRTAIREAVSEARL